MDPQLDERIRNIEVALADGRVFSRIVYALIAMVLIGFGSGMYWAGSISSNTDKGTERLQGEIDAINMDRTTRRGENNDRLDDLNGRVHAMELIVPTLTTDVGYIKATLSDMKASLSRIENKK